MNYIGHLPDHTRLYIFDLDGTLIDSLEDLTASVNEILSRFSMPPVSSEMVRWGIGNGARALLIRVFAVALRSLSPSSGFDLRSISADDIVDDPDPQSLNERIDRYPEFARFIDSVLQPYRDYYSTHCVANTRLYPGIREWLVHLNQRDCATAVLSNKPERISATILKELGVDHFFDVISGPESVGVLKPDPAGILRIMNQMGRAPGDTVMVGDSAVDVESGRNAGVLTCGITGGFCEVSTLRASRPDVLIERV